MDKKKNLINIRIKNLIFIKLVYRIFCYVVFLKFLKLFLYIYLFLVDDLVDNVMIFNKENDKGLIVIVMGIVFIVLLMIVIFVGIFCYCGK